MGRVLNMDDSYIDRKLKEDAMQKNLIKYWRVRFDSEEEEEEKEEKAPAKQEAATQEEDLFANVDENDEEMMRAKEIFERLQSEAAADDAALMAEQQAAYAEAEATQAWRERTGADGVYGQKPVESAAEKAQIDAILGERADAFDELLKQAQE